jgi:pyruvate/2-oxoglutarate dehydrogenase complex dihydrolipoamide dehydrogenase (E3) component
MYDVIVIGGGPAGVTAALRARELGAEVALVERGRLGGTCTNDGCVPTRVLARAARLVRESQHMDTYGLIGEIPKLDFEKLLARTSQVVYMIHEKKQLAFNLENAGVNLITEAGAASFVDAHTIKLEDGRQLTAEKFILCSGGHSRRLDFPGAEHALTHQDIWTLKKAPKSIAVVGGAATGCQLASIFNSYGVKVTVFERGERLLRIEDIDVSNEIEGSFLDQGIQVVSGISGITRIDKSDGMLELVYTKDNEELSARVEAIVLSTGWLGNVTNLNLEAAGVEHERNYVIVDEYLRTSAPHIFAAGDVNGQMMLVQSAGYEARIAAENAILGVSQLPLHHVVPHGGFTDPEYGSVGLTEEQASAQGDYVVAKIPYKSLDRAVIDGRTVGFCKLIVSQETHRILGAHIVGEQALESIQLVAAGMAANMWVEQLAELELAYPTYTAIIGLTARKIVRQLGVMPLAPQWLSLEKPLAEWERSE